MANNVENAGMSASYSAGMSMAESPMSPPPGRRVSTFTGLAGITNATTNKNAAMEKEVLALNQRLLDSIANGDYETYQSLSASDMTCIETDTNNLIVQGQKFHKYYFDLYQSMLSSGNKKKNPVQVTMVHPHVQLFMQGTSKEAVAVLAYVRLDQLLDPTVGRPTTIQCTETRIWSLKERGTWLNCHFHRSEAAAPTNER
jgi:Calcium/calmodulin dependent protein kinase II association domain